MQTWFTIEMLKVEIPWRSILRGLTGGFQIDIITSCAAISVCSTSAAWQDAWHLESVNGHPDLEYFGINQELASFDGWLPFNTLHYHWLPPPGFVESVLFQGKSSIWGIYIEHVYTFFTFFGPSSRFKISYHSLPLSASTSWTFLRFPPYICPKKLGCIQYMAQAHGRYWQRWSNPKLGELRGQAQPTNWYNCIEFNFRGLDYRISNWSTRVVY